MFCHASGLNVPLTSEFMAVMSASKWSNKFSSWVEKTWITSVRWARQLETRAVVWRSLSATPSCESRSDRDLMPLHLSGLP